MGASGRREAAGTQKIPSLLNIGKNSSSSKRKIEAPSEGTNETATMGENMNEMNDNTSNNEKNKRFQRLVKETSKKALKVVQNTGKAAGKATSILRKNKSENANTHDFNNMPGGGVSDMTLNSGTGETALDSQSVVTRTVVVGPWMEFWTADATIVWIVFLSLAIYPTVQHWQAIMSSQVPLSVMAIWLFVAYATGQVFSSSDWKTSHYMFSSGEGIISVGRTHAAEQAVQQTKRMRHSILMKTLAPTNVQLKFEDETAPPPSKEIPWTSLNPEVEKNNWQLRADPTKDTTTSLLMNRLLQDESISRVKRYDCTGEPIDSGGVNLARSNDPEDFVVDPILKFRAMDVFLTEDAETEAATHPFLIKHGLRDVPTVIINVVTQWGNILIYFEMPEWVQDWNAIQENETDADDVKALKRYLNGDDQYRTDRLMLSPAVVDGPLAVKLFAPPKKVLQIPGSMLSVTWCKHDGGTASDGRRQCPALEAQLDCVGNRTIRALVGILKRNFRRLSVDVAAMSTSEDETEPNACLGMWRFDYIDIWQCPQFPDRYAEEAHGGLDADSIRASKILQLTEAEIAEVAALDEQYD